MAVPGSRSDATFTIRYRFSGLAVGYDDVVDVNLKVWGDEWEQSLGRLTATMSGPGRVLRAWGKPVWVRGDVTIAGSRSLLRAVDVGAGQFVELRTLYPRERVHLDCGDARRGRHRARRDRRGGAADAEAYEQDRERIDSLKDNFLRTALIVLALAVVPALLVITAVFWLLGRERRTGYDREYEQEPPTDTEPALVPTLLRQGGEAGSYEFTATLFDLIRRGHYKAEPTTTERKVWGGLRTEEVSDLELSAGEPQELTRYEDDVAGVVDAVLDGGSERLSRFRDRIEDDRESMSERFESFKGAVGTEVARRKWFRSTGAIPLVLAGVVFAGVGALLVFLAQDGWRSVYPRYSDVVLVGVGIALVVNAALIGATVIWARRVWKRRNLPAQVEAERWDAFRRYLTDFPRLDEAPPRRSRCGSASSSTGSPSGSPTAFSRARRSTCRRPCTGPARSTGSRPEEISAPALEHVDRRPRVRLRQRARATELGRRRRRGRILGRWRRGRRRGRRRVRLSCAQNRNPLARTPVARRSLKEAAVRPLAAPTSHTSR